MAPISRTVTSFPTPVTTPSLAPFVDDVPTSSPMVTPSVAPVVSPSMVVIPTTVPTEEGPPGTNPADKDSPSAMPSAMPSDNPTMSPMSLTTAIPTVLSMESQPPNAPVPAPPVPTQGLDCESFDSETAFGEPTDQSNSVRIPTRWGWYWSTSSFAATMSEVTMDLWVGAGQYNDMNEGTFAGSVSVTVQECQSFNPLFASVDWTDAFMEPGSCVSSPPDNRHVHVGEQLPMVGKGKTTFAPGQYNFGCCTVGSPCFVIVHAAVSVYDDGCCHALDSPSASPSDPTRLTSFNPLDPVPSSSPMLPALSPVVMGSASPVTNPTSVTGSPNMMTPVMTGGPTQVVTPSSPVPAIPTKNPLPNPPGNAGDRPRGTMLPSMVASTSNKTTIQPNDFRTTTLPPMNSTANETMAPFNFGFPPMPTTSSSPASSVPVMSPLPNETCSIVESGTLFSKPNHNNYFTQMTGRFGYYHHEWYFTGNDSAYTMDTWMGTGTCQESQSQNLVYAGQIRVNVATCGCDDNSHKSSVDWSEVLEAENQTDLCLRSEPCERYVHVGNTLPTTCGHTSFAHEHFQLGCCVVGQPCFVIVEATVHSYERGCCSCDSSP
ncbi:expressed unknown protein [Seminavis robusta]|uniref:Uncharacterized protein n=1 Tax=Seminavis robusta TaxID=568900 RepID=A0A9N8F264_9STRA|nr:expressed unknown protein [Seminavis robusta]|eukprot:Sro2759_g336380.1 n/a (602) ;mRNA; f:192-1997